MADEKISKEEKSESDMTPQELEAKRAADEAKEEEKRQKHIEQLIKTKKYFLPIK